MKMKKLTRSVLFIAPIFFVVFSGGFANAKTFRMIIGTGWPPVVKSVAQLRDFFAPEIKKRVEATTDHKIDWVFAFGGSVVKPGEGLEGTQDGIVDFGFVAYGFEPAKLSLYNWGYALPFARRQYGNRLPLL